LSQRGQLARAEAAKFIGWAPNNAAVSQRGQAAGANCEIGRPNPWIHLVKVTMKVGRGSEPQNDGFLHSECRVDVATKARHLANAE
jgi:hypothetical protein